MTTLGTTLAFDQPPRPPRRGEAVGLLVALVGHVVAFAVLSASLLAKPEPVKIQEQPIDVTLTDKVGLVATAPQSVTPPAQSVAPEAGPPEDAAPPVPSKPAPTAAPPTPAKAAPAPLAKPEPKPKPAPSRPAPAEADKPSKSQAHAAALPNPAAFRTPGNGKAGEKPRAKGATLGDDFLKGLDDKPSKSRSQTPRAAAIDANALASITGAIARQIQPCADRQVNPGPGANRIVTTLNLRLNEDGTLAATPTMVRQTGIDAENNRYARRVVDLGVAAFKGCSPLKLPPEYYSTPSGGWNNINYNWQLR